MTKLLESEDYINNLAHCLAMLINLINYQINFSRGVLIIYIRNSNNSLKSIFFITVREKIRFRIMI